MFIKSTGELHPRVVENILTILPLESEFEMIKLDKRTQIRKHIFKETNVHLLLETIKCQIEVDSFIHHYLPVDHLGRPCLHSHKPKPLFWTTVELLKNRLPTFG